MKRATTLARAVAVVLIACAVYQISAADDEEHSVIKRALPTVVGIMNAFQRAQYCCTLPVMLPRADTTCSNRVRSGFTVLVSRGIFGAWQSLGTNEKGLATESGAAQACYFDCVFNSMDMISNSTTGGVLNVANITENFSARVNATWEETVSNATTFCMNKIETLKVTTVRHLGKVCSTLPLMFMVCFKRQLFANCPSPSQSASCHDHITIIRNRGVFMGLNLII